MLYILGSGPWKGEPREWSKYIQRDIYAVVEMEAGRVLSFFYSNLERQCTF